MVGQLIKLSLPNKVEVELDCDNMHILRIYNKIVIFLIIIEQELRVVLFGLAKAKF